MGIRGVYAIVDTGFLPDLSPEELALEYLKGGIRTLQLRDKKCLFRGAAAKIGVLRKNFPFLFIINDDLELALQVDADGVHIGKDDLPVEECRRRLGPDKIIGYSSHSLQEALEAEQKGADYVAFGAIYPTSTKGPGHPLQGVSRLREVVSALRVSVVAIGGIGRDNIKEVLSTGVASVAMISGLASAPDRIETARFFCRLFQKEEVRVGIQVGTFTEKRDG